MVWLITYDQFLTGIFKNNSVAFYYNSQILIL